MSRSGTSRPRGGKKTRGERPSSARPPRGKKRARAGTLIAVLAGVGTLAFFGAFVLLVVFRQGPPRIVERVASFVPGMVVTVTIPEGFQQFQIAERLETLEVCSRKDFLAATHDPVLLRRFGIPGASAEGYLFPATYRFLVRAEASRVVEHLLEAGVQRRARLFAGHETTEGLDVHQLITLASIIERESSVEAERPRIARVFYNRLASPEGESRGRLQSDPTAAYGCLSLGASIPSCESFRGTVTPAMLRDEKNPYNTYRIPGLPPGPIANPGESSLRAALVPAAGEDLYFVADGSGRHTFSRTYDEHQKAVARLRTNPENQPK